MNKNQISERMIYLANSRRRYNALSFNCHHASSYLINGIEESFPVDALKVAGVVGGLTVFGLVLNSLSESNKRRRKLR